MRDKKIIFVVTILMLSLALVGVIFSISYRDEAPINERNTSQNGDDNLLEEPEKQINALEYEVNMDNIIYSSNKDESVLVIQEGKLSIADSLKYYLDNDTTSKNQAYAVRIKFFSNDYNTYREENLKTVDEKYSVQTEKLMEELSQAKQNSYDLYKQTELSVLERSNELGRKHREETSNVELEAYEKYFQPILPLIEELGIEVVEKNLTFVQNNEVWYSEVYCITYLDAYLIEQLNSVVSGKEFGLGIELAPNFVNRDSSTVDLTDPYFGTLVE